MAKEPKYTWVNPKDPKGISQMKVFGYYYKSDLTRSNVPYCGGRRYRLPSGEEVTVTRMWCNANPKFDFLDMFSMGMQFVENKPPSTNYVADLTNATLLATYTRPIDADPFYQTSDAGWKTVSSYAPHSTVLESIGTHLSKTSSGDGPIVIGIQSSSHDGYSFDDDDSW